MGVLSQFGVDEERLTEILKIHDENMKWMYDNFEEIQNSYTSKFIAIYKKRVVSDDSDRRKLFDSLKEKYTEKEIEEIFVNFINPKGSILILFFTS